MLAIALAVGCSPTLDWREFVPEGSAISVTFPCRSDHHARPVMMAGAKIRMEMLVCGAGDATYALSFFDLDDPARVTPVLAEWRATAAANLQAPVPPLVSHAVKGATPNAQAGRVVVNGRLPDGAPVQEHALFFAHGLRAYAATVIGARPSSQAVETFFAGLRFPG